MVVSQRLVNLRFEARKTKSNIEMCYIRIPKRDPPFLIRYTEKN